MKELNYRKKYSLLAIALLLFFLATTSIFSLHILDIKNKSKRYYFDKTIVKTNIPRFSNRYYDHSSLYIDGNEEFENYGLTGNGTFSNPYIIDDFKITSNESVASISIANSNVYFQINRCFLQNGTSGLSLFNVSNVKIVNTIFVDNENGISLLNTTNIIIANNSMINNQIGIKLIERNYDSIISENVIINNSFNGVTSLFSSSFTISLNNISDNGEYGIFLAFSNNFTLSYNNFSKNNLEGVFITSTVNNIEIKRNNFFQNNPNGASQSFDNGVRNVFNSNYWDEWTNPDSNNDGVVDRPYSIRGNSNSSDLWPQTHPNSYPPSENKSATDDSESVFIAAALLITSSGVVIGGVLVGKRNLNRRKSSRFPIDIDDEEEWSKAPWFIAFITPIIWFISQILYPPQVRRLSRAKVLDNPIRQKILEILEEREFDHYNSLKSQLDCGISIFEWHLQVLEDFGLIRTRIVGQYRIFYLSYRKLDEFKLKIYFSVRSKKGLLIAQFLMNEPSKFHNIKKISESIDMKKKTALYHCLKLVSIGLLIKEKKTNNFMIIENQKEYINWLIERHQSTFN